jgi:hypothetical protein
MKNPMKKRDTRSPIWIILGAALLVVAGLLLVMAFLNPGTAAPTTTTATSTSTPGAVATTASTTAPETSDPDPTALPDEALAATVNGYAITQSYLSQTVRLNQVLGELSGASVMGEKETLQRLIRSQLILQGVEEVEEPSSKEVEGFISNLEDNWDVSDETVAQELQAVGLERAFLEDTIKRLLTVQASVARLEANGHNVSEWLYEQEQDAEIMVYEDLAQVEDEEIVSTPLPTEQIEPPTSTPVPQPEVPDVATNFTLKQAGGGTFTLEDQLAEGPVVLVFFERCG